VTFEGDGKRISKRFIAFGGYLPEDEKHRATDIMLSIAEYERQQTEMRSLKAQVDYKEDQIRELKASQKREIERLRREYEQESENEQENIRQEYELKQKELNQSVRNARFLAKKWEDLNKNLLRIMKERANSKRGLQPKKERSGYQLLSSQEYQYIYKHEIVVKEATFNRPEITRTVTNKAFCFKTIIQSPFDAKLPILDVKLLFYKDLLKAPLKYLGVKDTHEFDESILNSNENYMFKADVRANFRSGFMEIEILTTKQINVPEDLIIPEK
jgi:hypothetical protein